MPDWPADLPQDPLRSGFSERLGSNKIRTSMSVSFAKVRRRATARVDAFNVSMLMTAAQQATFENLFDNILYDGSLSFEWQHPRKEIPSTCRIVGEPSYTLTGDLYMVSFALEVLP